MVCSAWRKRKQREKETFLNDPHSEKGKDRFFGNKRELILKKLQYRKIDFGEM